MNGGMIIFAHFTSTVVDPRLRKSANYVMMQHNPLTLIVVTVCNCPSFGLIRKSIPAFAANAQSNLESDFVRPYEGSQVHEVGSWFPQNAHIICCEWDVSLLFPISMSSQLYNATTLYFRGADLHLKLKRKEKSAGAA